MKAAMLLHPIRSYPDRLDLVLALQQHLIRQITRLERRSKRVQRAAANMRNTLRTTRQPRDQAKALRERIKDCLALLEKIRGQMFIWRCFGDGIAFAYQSKYALKHLYYDRNYNVKQPAGFLSGKSGFRLEWKVVRRGIKMGIPVVLADITNVIRYGEVTVVVLIDMMALKERFQEIGGHCVFLMEGTYSMQICKNPKNLMEGVFRLSELVFARVAAEFQSLAWFAKEHGSALDDLEALVPLSLEEAKTLPGVGWSPPTDWYTVKDFFDNTEDRV